MSSSLAGLLMVSYSRVVAPTQMRGRERSVRSSDRNDDDDYDRRRRDRSRSHGSRCVIGLLD